MSTEFRSVGEAFGLTIVGIVAALTAVSGIRTIVAALHLQETTLTRIIQFGQVQVGFLAVALGYLVYIDKPRRFAKFHLPSFREIVWLILLGLIIFVFSAPDESWFLTSALMTTPSIWLVVIIW